LLLRCRVTGDWKRDLPKLFLRRRVDASLALALKIERAIYFIRGEKVMLDRDLADLYGVETKMLNRAVRRNLRRFPGFHVSALGR